MVRYMCVYAPLVIFHGMTSACFHFWRERFHIWVASVVHIGSILKKRRVAEHIGIEVVVNGATLRLRVYKGRCSKDLDLSSLFSFVILLRMYYLLSLAL